MRPLAGPEAALADDEIYDAGKDGTDQPAHLRRVVGPVGLHEDHRQGAAGGGHAGAAQARVAVASRGLTQDLAARGADDLHAAVRGAVVHEDRALEQAQGGQLDEQRGQRLRLVEDRHDDEVVG